MISSSILGVFLPYAISQASMTRPSAPFAARMPKLPAAARLAADTELPPGDDVDVGHGHPGEFEGVLGEDLEGFLGISGWLMMYKWYL